MAALAKMEIWEEQLSHLTDLEVQIDVLIANLSDNLLTSPKGNTKHL